MDSEGSTEPRGRGITFWVILFLILLILVGYPLSPGPVVAIVGPRQSKSLDTFYAPLEFAANKVPAIKSFYAWYIPLWIKKPPTSFE